MTRKTIEDIYPLSPAQQGILFQCLAAPGSGIHVEQLLCALEGEVHRPAFERAWQAVLDRHPMLRTGFAWKDVKEPLQAVRRQVSLPQQSADWRALSSDEQDARLHAYLDADRKQGFDLFRPPLIRLALFQLAPNRYQFVWTHSHILMDGWCGPVLLSEFLTFYRAFAQGQEVRLPAPRPYRDYIRWLKGRDLSQAEAFWRKTLENFKGPTPLGLPDSANGPDSDARYGEHRASLSAETTAALKSLAQQRRVTLYTILQGAWALLLSRYSGETDVTFGTTVSGRPPDLPGVESTIGLFINTLPVRVHVNREASLWALLEDIQAYNLELQPYEFSPGNLVHAASGLPGSLPLYQSLFVFENYPVDLTGLRASGLVIDLSAVRSEGARTGFPLTLLVVAGSVLGFQLAWDARRFDTAAARRILDHLRTILSEMAAATDQPLGRLVDGVPADQIPRVRSLSTRARPSAESYVDPRTPTEATLAAICAELLGVPRVGVFDNFFELGGHSLLAIQLYYRVRAAYSVDILVQGLFEDPTIAHLARVVDALGRGERPAARSDRRVTELKSEAALELPHLTAARPFQPMPEPSRIFLTGPTGFLGKYLLHDLLRQTTAEIYCLVRAETAASGRQRLERNLKASSLWSEDAASRIVPVVGDLAQPRLGLPPREFETLAEQMDVIYHAGASVSYLLPYSWLKAPNVLGTEQVLQLASQSRVKPVHYVSSLAVFPLVNPGEEMVVTETDDLDHGGVLFGGYEQSKWVAERLVMLARDRGLPVVIYRPGLITGHSRSGVGNTDNLISAILKRCIQLGRAPDMDTFLDMTPVDFVSHADRLLVEGSGLLRAGLPPRQSPGRALA